LRLARVYQVNPDFKKQLAKAFGLGSEADFDGLVAKLRAGEAVDPAVLRKGTLALVDNIREFQASHVDTRVKVALEASNLALWEWDLTTGNIFVDRTYFGFLGLDRDAQVMPITELQALVSPEDLQVFQDDVAATVRGDAPLFQVQHRMRHADGRWVWLETSGSVSGRDATGASRA
jgi:PAS domain-containing protein